MRQRTPISSCTVMFDVHGTELPAVDRLALDLVVACEASVSVPVKPWFCHTVSAGTPPTLFQYAFLKSGTVQVGTGVGVGVGVGVGRRRRRRRRLGVGVGVGVPAAGRRRCRCGRRRCGVASASAWGSGDWVGPGRMDDVQAVEDRCGRGRRERQLTAEDVADERRQEREGLGRPMTVTWLPMPPAKFDATWQSIVAPLPGAKHVGLADGHASPAPPWAWAFVSRVGGVRDGVAGSRPRHTSCRPRARPRRPSPRGRRC